MKIKKFFASSMQAAFDQVKAEFGDDAIILNTKQIKNGEDPEHKGSIEVTAAIDKKETDEQLVKPRFRNKLDTYAGQRQESQTVSSSQYNLLFKEIDYLSERMEVLINHVKYKNLPHIPKLLQKRAKALITNGVNHSLANEMIEETLLNLKGEELMQEEFVDDKLLAKIKNKLQITGPVRFNLNQPTIIVLVGPTGVGKTTTIAKLAALYTYTYNKKVALVSIDSYQIAAMEQLRTFAEIASIDFVSAYDNSDLLLKYKQLQNHSLILVDTAGINPRNMKRMITLKETLRIAKADEVHLILSLTTRGQDLREIIKSFSILNFTGIIFSKLDETTSFGDVLNISVDFNKAISYLTMGQNIPEDIKLADRKELAMMVLRGKYGVL